MNPTKLKKGQEYWYTAGVERVKVVFLRETLNGYVFTDGHVENEVHKLTVEKYIEPIKP